MLVGELNNKGGCKHEKNMLPEMSVRACFVCLFSSKGMRTYCLADRLLLPETKKDKISDIIRHFFQGGRYVTTVPLQLISIHLHVAMRTNISAYQKV